MFSTSTPDRATDFAIAQRCKLGLAYLLFVLVLWTLLPALFQAVAHADNIEQINWAHHAQWGYVKHPPLPTWLLIAAEQFLTPTATLTYAMAMSCVIVTLCLLYCLARELTDPHTAIAATVVASANYYLMGRGSFYNHNTVMLPFVAATAWAVVRIVQNGQHKPSAMSLWPWLLMSLSTVLGLLTKYQMAVISATACVALIDAGVLRSVRLRWAMLFSAMLVGVLLLPHFFWLQAHQFSTFNYAGRSLLADNAPSHRLLVALGYLAQQIGRLAPALLLLGLLGAFKPSKGHPLGLATPQTAGLRALTWMAWFPTTVVLGMALLGGVAVQNHWGASTTLLIPIWICLVVRSKLTLSWPRLWISVLAIQLAAGIWFIHTARTSTEFHFRFPAKQLAAQANDLWLAQCPDSPTIVAGPDWEAGAIAMNLPQHPNVLASGDRRYAAWVDDQQIAQNGVLIFWRPNLDLIPQIGTELANSMVPFGEISAVDALGHTWTLKVGARLPVSGCKPIKSALP